MVMVVAAREREKVNVQKEVQVSLTTAKHYKDAAKDLGEVN